MPRISMQKSLQTRSNQKRVSVISTARAFGQKSPLVEKDIQHFLSKCMSSWDGYSDEEKRSIVQSLPISRRPQGSLLRNSFSTTNLSLSNASVSRNTPHSAERKPNCQDSIIPPLSADFVASDKYIKRTVARFKRDVSDGYYEKTWQEKAKKSHAERKEGKFDEYLEQCVNDMFSTDQDSDELSDSDCESDRDFGQDKKGRKRLRY